MSFIAWNDKLSVGVEVLDNDHQKMVALINELYDSLQDGSGRETLGDILNRLVDYIQVHFAREEDFFRFAQYPEAADHIREHQKMWVWAQGIRSGFQSDSIPGAPLVVMNQLKDWLFDHIVGSDQRYGPYLNAHGIR